MTISGVDLGFWGKARPDADAVASYHPIAYHLLDVAACAKAILRVRPGIRAHAASLLGLPEDDAVRLLVVLIALHDLGKFAPAFQVQCPELWPAALGGCVPEQVRHSRHTRDGFTLWHRALEPSVIRRLWPGGENVLRALAPAIFGHHGTPVGDRMTSGTATQVMGKPGLAAALQCADVLLSLLHPEPIDAPDLTVEGAARASWWVAGLTTLADWIGSNQRWFPYVAPLTADPSLAIYWGRAQQAAAIAVRTAGLVAPASASPKSFEVLTTVATPTPVQSWAAEVALPEGPLLAVIEDVTGAGKTEAAQMLVHRLMSTGRASGAYWAMPTQATANAMYSRQAVLLRELFADDGDVRPSLVLAHGQQRLHDAFRSTVLDGTTEVGETKDPERACDDELPSSAWCAAFLADDRRAALLADVGAGTVDQALLGVLPSRFNTLRLFALADKVLVVDEAHAYDAYMTIEVQELLRFHAALGGHAIVLSATLSQGQRASLCAAWLDGLAGARSYDRPAVNGDAFVHASAFPLATLVSGTACAVREFPLDAASWSCRKIGVRLVTTVEEAAAYVVEASARGAVAWVRNTVDDCLAAAGELRARGILPIVFHARFAQGDRQRREDEIMKLFGKSDLGAERCGRVVVATQVIEQSLDLDFDAMVSDLAPVDLLLQRAGRLQRHHKRKRADGSTCELVVLAPTFLDDPPADWVGGIFAGTAKVYKNVGVLWRTMRELKDRSTIAIPDDLRSFVEQVYGSDDIPESLLKIAERAKGEERASASTANYVTLDVARGYDADGEGWVNDLLPLTRLGSDQTTVRLARVTDDGGLEPWIWTDDPLWKRWALSEVRLSRWKVPEHSTAEPRFEAAVDRIRDEWRRYEQRIPVIPLERGTEASWRATILRPDGKAPIGVVYTEGEGLAYAGPDAPAQDAVHG